MAFVHEPPNQWKSDDPSQLFCTRYYVDLQRLPREVQRIRVTDRELARAAEWPLKVRVPEASAWPQVRRVLVLKVEDRQLMPVARQCNETLARVRQAVEALDAEVAEVVAFATARADLTTLEGLKAAWRAAHAPRVAAGRDGGV
jgi:hypothetical protein